MTREKRYRNWIVIAVVIVATASLDQLSAMEAGGKLSDLLAKDH
jgi:hypothetical protein